jgi:hypothetical protein
MARFSPTLGVTNPSTTLPTVTPSQNPVAVMPLANRDAWRMVIINVTIHPPSPTSTPMYINRNAVIVHVVLAAGSVPRASFAGMPLPFVFRG